MEKHNSTRIYPDDSSALAFNVFGEHDAFSIADLNIDGVMYEYIGTVIGKTDLQHIFNAFLVLSAIRSVPGKRRPTSIDAGWSSLTRTLPDGLKNAQ